MQISEINQLTLKKAVPLFLCGQSLSLWWPTLTSSVTVSPFQGKLPLLLSRMKEVGKVFLATNSDYKYTDVST